jgi:hypothetical protein
LQAIAKKFEKMGARLRVSALKNPRGRPFVLDIRKDGKGEFFDLQINDLESCEVVNIDPADRHLLLAIQSGNGTKEKFLCGHDERHWFAAGVTTSATTVKKAKEALRPRSVNVSSLREKDKLKRRNEAYIRQGEWFFMPRPELQVDKKLILYKEPLRRGRSKPHMAEELYREGGVAVMVSRFATNGFTDREYEKFLKEYPNAKNISWRRMMRNPTAYVRGRITHPDHKTVVLMCWHQVVASDERSPETLAFLD